MVLNGVGCGPILVAAARFQRVQFVFCDLPESVIEDPTLFDELKTVVGNSVQMIYNCYASSE